jgi:hypothetical protein
MVVLLAWMKGSGSHVGVTVRALARTRKRVVIRNVEKGNVFVFTIEW